MLLLGGDLEGAWFRDGGWLSDTHECEWQFTDPEDAVFFHDPMLGGKNRSFHLGFCVDNVSHSALSPQVGTSQCTMCRILGETYVPVTRR